MLNLFTPDLGLFFWQTIILLVVLLILRKYAWEPILRTINKQEAAYEQAAQEAAKARNVVRLLQNKSESILDRANARSKEIVQKALVTKKALLKEAEIEAQQACERLQQEMQQAMAQKQQAALLAMKQEIATLIIQTSEKLLQQELKEENKQQVLLEKLIAQTKTSSQAPKN